MKIDPRQLRKLLNETRPHTRFKPLVRRSRRAVWILVGPVIRYLFEQYAYSLRSLTGVVHGIRDGAALRFDRADARIERLEAECDRLSGLYQSLLGEFPKFIQPIIEFRTEAAALVNRGAILEADIMTLSAEVGRLMEGQILSAALEVARQTEAASEMLELQVRIEDRLSGVLQDLVENAVTARSVEADTVGRLAVDLAELKSGIADGALDRRFAVIESELREDIARVSESAIAALAGADRLEIALAGIRRDVSVAPDRGVVDMLVREMIDMRRGMGALEGVRAFAEIAQPKLVALTSLVEAGAVRTEQQLGKLEADLTATQRVFNEAAGELQRTIGSVSDRTDEANRHSQIFLSVNKNSVTLLRAGDLISEVVASEGEWDGHLVDLMDAVRAHRTGIAIDVGAQFGLISIAMGQRFERVISFEPNDFNYRMLTANIALNGLRNVECHNHPLFSSDVVLSLGTPEQQEGAMPLTPEGRFNPMTARNSASYTFTETGMPEYSHRARTLDSLNLADVIFIKIDVQGADGEVIMGARETLDRCRPVVVFEWEEHLSKMFSVSFEDIKRELGASGYSINVLKRHNAKQVDYVAYPRDFRI